MVSGQPYAKHASLVKDGLDTDRSPKAVGTNVLDNGEPQPSADPQGLDGTKGHKNASCRTSKAAEENCAAIQ